MANRKIAGQREGMTVPQGTQQGTDTVVATMAIPPKRQKPPMFTSEKIMEWVQDMEGLKWMWLPLLLRKPPLVSKMDGD